MFSLLAWYYIVFTSSGRTYKLLVVIWRDYYKMSQEFLSSRNFGKIFYSTPLTSTRNLEVNVCVLHKCACWWRQLLCAGLQQLMRTRTSKKFFLSRLTPDMESKLLFIMTKVRFGQQKRYQEWFQKQVINTVTTLNCLKLLFLTSCDLIPLFFSIYQLPRASHCAATWFATFAPSFIPPMRFSAPILFRAGQWLAGSLQLAQ